MRIIMYNLLHKTPGGSGILLPKELPYTEENIAIAEDEAYNGEYFIEDDGQPEPEAKPTEAERIAQLEEALALLLSGVTE